MASSLEHRSTFPTPITTVYPTLVDEAFLRARLEEIGGKGATLLEYDRAGETVDYRFRQGVDAARLPGAVRSILGGDLVVERVERWRPDGQRFAADSEVVIGGVPGSIRGQSRLGDHGGGSVLVIRAEVRVGIPLLGAKLEKLVAEQVAKLLAAESEFAEKWLAERA